MADDTLCSEKRTVTDSENCELFTAWVGGKGGIIEPTISPMMELDSDTFDKLFLRSDAAADDGSR